MTTKQLISRITIIFVALTVAGISVAVSALVVPNAIAQMIMVAFGSAIFGAGLVFFLIRVSTLS